MLQLTHDSNEKAAERKAALRREVYLSAAERFVTVNNLIISIPSLDVAKSSTADGLHGFLVSSAKVTLVADADTARLVTELVALCLEIYIKAQTRSLPMITLQSHISVVQEYYNRSQADISRVLANMSQFNESAQMNNEEFSALQKSLTLYQKRANELASQLDTLREEMNTLYQRFVKEMLPDLRLMSNVQLPVIVAIRRELGVDGDMAAINSIFETQWNRLEQQLSQLSETLD